MSDLYVDRSLRLHDDDGNERVVPESQIGKLRGPVIVLGDPGLGKTKLTESLERALVGRRVLGGTFVRTRDVKRQLGDADRKLIIDGLDEIAASTGGAAVDQVLEKLSTIGYPNFILSCRAADWQGSTARYKIDSDYGTPPTVLSLLPFSYEDARRFLADYGSQISPEDVLYELNRRDLGEFYGNPLTLKLIAELVIDGQGLPESQAELLEKSCRLLVREMNFAHQQSDAARCDIEQLLSSAGAAFALSLLSGSVGISDRSRDETPTGFIPAGTFKTMPGAPFVDAALRTRLFQSTGEKLFIAIHRVIAEFLGARWIAERLAAGVSERRVFQCLTVENVVPTPLRGLHAWLAYYSQRVAARCIKSDPYGVLRYGEVTRFPISLMRQLLASLQAAADEDPYFRGDYWSARTVVGLAHGALKGEIVEIITNSDRHFQLSMLMIDALQGAQLTDEILPELLSIVGNANAAHAERLGAATAIWRRNQSVDWTSLIVDLLRRKTTDENRLAVELITLTSGAELSEGQIADAVIECQQVFEEERSRGYVSGVDRGLVPKLSASICAKLLDEFAVRLASSGRPRHWRAGLEFSSTLYALIAKVLTENELPDAARVWSWLKHLEDERSYDRGHREEIDDFLLKNRVLRRQMQVIAMQDPAISEEPWMAIIHTLPSVSSALALTAEDTVSFLTEIAGKEAIAKQDSDAWFALLRHSQISSALTDEVRKAADSGAKRHPELNKIWQDIASAPVHDWQAEQERRERRRKQRLAAKFKAHRGTFLPHVNDIRHGKNLGALVNIAHAYLGRFHDLSDEVGPAERLKGWLGEELAEAALAGFVAVLHREDLPTARQISELHAQEREYNVEAPIKCAVAELLSKGRGLNNIPMEALRAALVSWWHIPEPDSDKSGVNVGERLEELVLASRDERLAFLRSVMEPQLDAKREHMSSLYRMGHEASFRGEAGELAIRWLRDYPQAHARVQSELIEIAIQSGRMDDLQALARERIASIQSEQESPYPAWMSAAFAVDFENSLPRLRAFCAASRDTLWVLRDVVRAERGKRGFPVSARQLEFIVDTYAKVWPPASHPSSGWSGDTNPWDASEFLYFCITGIGADIADEAYTALDGIVERLATTAYAKHAKHIRAQQRQRRWDSEYAVPTFDHVKSVFSSGAPIQIDDLRAVIVEGLQEVGVYIRNGDTRGWRMFWNRELPEEENTCRDRILDLLRPRIRQEISLMPETAMPDAKRVDISAIYGPIGLPVEIKGQWHKAVWEASSVQLDESYTRDWRASGRGVYVALWFGNVAQKALRAHPQGIRLPTTATQFQSMLLDRLNTQQRSRIDVLVIDLSKPTDQ